MRTYLRRISIIDFINLKMLGNCIIYYNLRYDFKITKNNVKFCILYFHNLN